MMEMKITVEAPDLAASILKLAEAIASGPDPALLIPDEPLPVSAYCNLTTPRASQQGGEPKFSVTLLIPKTDTATKADIDAAINAAAQEALTKTWNGARPPVLKVPIHDGDGVRQSGVPFGDECKGHWVITASTKNKPQVVGIDNINCELAPSDIYSGMYQRRAPKDQHGAQHHPQCF